MVFLEAVDNLCAFKDCVNYFTKKLDKDLAENTFTIFLQPSCSRLRAAPDKQHRLTIGYPNKLQWKTRVEYHFLKIYNYSASSPITENVVTSTRPRSVIFKFGITGNARNDN